MTLCDGQNSDATANPQKEIPRAMLSGGKGPVENRPVTRIRDVQH